MLLVRSIVMMLVAALAVAALAVGCGDSGVQHDAAATYSPDSLAQELIFRYKSLDADKRNVRKAAPARTTTKASPKAAKADTKEAQATTLDDLIREIRSQAELVPGKAVPAVMQEVADTVAKDTSLTEADRKLIVDRLRAGGE